MSLPTPSTSKFPRPDPKEEAEMDALLTALASKSKGDLRRLLSSFFSFLHRRTDFYVIPHEEDLKEGVPLKMGFPEGDAEKLLLASFRQFPLRRMPRRAALESGKVVKESKPVAGVAKKEKEESKQTSCESSDPMADVRITEDGKQIPIGNGGVTPRYRWTQTLDETSVVLQVPPGTKGKDLRVDIKPSSLSVRLKSAPDADTMLEGDLVQKIRTDESTWSLEGGALLLTLDKLQKTWWDTVLRGDPVIDTGLVDSTRKIGEYDEATQGAIRKILFDQRQQRLGLPTSDQMLGKEPEIPPLPSGVEYIGKEEMDRLKKESSSTK